MAPAVDFPDSPTAGQLFYNPNNGSAYIYGTNGVWSQYASALSEDPNYGVVGSVYVGIEPTNPAVGTLWYPTGPGTLGLGYIWNGAGWSLLNEGKVGSGTTANRPDSPDTGDLFFNTASQRLEVYSGTAWVTVQASVDAADVTFASGTGLTSTNVKDALDEVDGKVNAIGSSLIYGGTYNAATNKIATVTVSGSTAGLAVGQPLPAIATNVYVIVSDAGTGTAPAPTVQLDVGNWLVNNGFTWDLLQLNEPQTSAALVSFSPTGGIAAVNVQNALAEVDSEKANKTTTITAGTGLSGGGDLSSNVTINMENSGVTAGTYGSSTQTPRVTVDATGRVTSATTVSPQDASLTQKGVVQLNNTTSSTSTTQAATPNSVRVTYDTALAASGTAGNALAVANAAQADATQALSDSAAAQADATQALADAATAQAAADNAQTDANTALANAATAQAAANAAQATANQAVSDAADAQQDANTNTANIGALTSLTTTNKSSIVAAVNEVQAETNTAQSTANQAIADAAAAQATADAALPLAGGTMTGEIVARTVDVQSGYFIQFANGANGFQDGISNSVTSTSISKAASSQAVKTANDAAVAAQSTANSNTSKIGTLANLQTTDKSNLVNAINEHETRIDNLGTSLVYGGTYNATTNLVASVTAAGTAAGLIVGNALITGGATANIFLIVSVAGTGTAPAPVTALGVGDWIVSNGTTWQHLQLGTPSTDASLVTFSPAGDISATDVQAALEELDNEKVPNTRQVVAGIGLAGGGPLSADVTVDLEASGVTAGTFGSDGLIPSIQVDTYGRITNISEVTASLDGLSDVDVSTVLPTDGQVLTYDATAMLWEPQTFTSTGVTNPEVNATQSNFIHVDAVNGDDLTGVVGDMTKPFKTIKAALAAASPPNMVVVSEGTYNEANPINVPAGVQIISRCGTLGWVHTNVIPTNPLDDLFVFQGDKSGITGISVTTPTAAGKAAVVYAGPSGTTVSATFMGIRGTTGGLGTGILCKSVGTGKIISFEVRYLGGDMDCFTQVDGGIIANESTHVPNTPIGGGPNVVFRNTNSIGAPISRLQIANSNSGNSNVQHVFEAVGGVSVFHGANWFQAANGIHVTTNTYDVLVSSGLIDCTSSIIVDSGLTGANGRLHVFAQMNNAFTYPYTWSASDYALEFTTQKTDPNSKGVAKAIHGSDVIVGEHHRGSGLSVGRGAQFKDGLTVFTSNSTATSTTEGGNLTNVTAAAVDKSGTTFTFQGTAANHCIYFCTNELDDTGTYIKHYGLDIEVTTGDSRNGSYVFEIWNGSAWARVGSQAVSSGVGYSYGNKHFWRSGSEENIFYGIRQATLWVSKAIGGVTGYWSRVRIATAPTTVPIFETVSLIPQGTFSVTSEGVIEQFGLAMPAVINTQGSNIFSENGNVTPYTFTMGSGTNAYTHTINNVLLDQVGEGLYWQTAIVPGICTALPLYIEIGYSLGTTTTVAPVFDVYFQPIETSGTLVADTTGGIVAVPRTEANTKPYTGAGSDNPTKLTIPVPYLQANKLHRARLGPFDVTNFFEGDAVAFEVQLASKGTPLSDVAIWGVAVIGYSWTNGIRGY